MTPLGVSVRLLRLPFIGRCRVFDPVRAPRARFGEVVHNVILELKGRLDDRDKRKARAGAAHAELLRRHDKEPWHYLFLIESSGEGREDVSWWEDRKVPTLDELLRRHEAMPPYPGEQAPAIRRLAENEPSAVPVVEDFSATPTRWASVTSRHELSDDVFAAQNTDKGLEPRVPSGAWGLFRRVDSKPPRAALDRRVVLVEQAGGSKRVMRRLFVTTLGESGEIIEAELRGEGKAPRILVGPSSAEFVVRAELLEILG